MTDTDLRIAAVEYAATGRADPAQFYTSTSCDVRSRTPRYPEDKTFVHVQLWLVVPRNELNELVTCKQGS